MKPPKSFLDFTLQFHQDLDLTDPGWASESPDARRDIYRRFRDGFGDQAVDELAKYFQRALSSSDAQLRALWNRKSKADWILSGDGVRKILEDFVGWAASSK